MAVFPNLPLIVDKTMKTFCISATTKLNLNVSD